MRAVGMRAAFRAASGARQRRCCRNSSPLRSSRARSLEPMVEGLETDAHRASVRAIPIRFGAVCVGGGR